MEQPSERKTMVLAFGLWLLGWIGVCGLHRLYVGKTGSGLLYLFTLGLCGFGQLIDLILIPDQIKAANRLAMAADRADWRDPAATAANPERGLEDLLDEARRSVERTQRNDR